MPSEPIETIVRIFNDRGNDRYGVECVSQREHAIQAALLAESAGLDQTQIVAALLHDIGHILYDSDLPKSSDQDLNDFHEAKAYEWLLHHFGKRVADPVRLHVAAKRYLCTRESDYVKVLSPTSLKSFYDQGGLMSSDELCQFENEPFYREAQMLRRWDDLAKEESKKIPSIENFVPLLKKCLVNPTV